jgi:membrane protein implicated in regulation of membrane protease activity
MRSPLGVCAIVIGAATLVMGVLVLVVPTPSVGLGIVFLVVGVPLTGLGIRAVARQRSTQPSAKGEPAFSRAQPPPPRPKSKLSQILDGLSPFN